MPRLVPLAAPRARIAAALFPPDALGKTFVWDTTAKGYVASNDPGAPANGVRFVIYATNGGLLIPVEPSLPLTPLGYVDLTDRSAGGNSVMGITLVGTEGGAATTYADYTLTVPAGTIASTLALAGFVSDGVNRLDLTSAFTSTLSAFTTHTTADVAAQDVHLVETAALAGTTTPELSLDLSLTSGGSASDATGPIGVLSARKKCGASDVKLRNRRVAVEADTELSCDTVRVASASLGGAAGAVPPPHPAMSRGSAAPHTTVGLRERRDMVASDVVAGRPQE